MNLLNEQIKHKHVRFLFVYITLKLCSVLWLPHLPELLAALF